MVVFQGCTSTFNGHPGFEEGSLNGEDSGFEEVRLSHISI